MKQGVLSKFELSEYIKWSFCPNECKSLHVAKPCSYVIAEVPELNLKVKVDAYRTRHENKRIALNAIYDLYLKY